MHETEADVAALQALLDRSYAAAGEHLLSIHPPTRRLDAPGVVELLGGMCLLALATVSAAGRPFVGPVDGIFHRGSFHFGSAADSLRFRAVPGCAARALRPPLWPGVGAVPGLGTPLRPRRSRAAVRLLRPGAGPLSAR
ncbi:MAG TPA: hypothetical protein VLZ06_08900 [Solirubrobacteraceae bacterium]|nr:hypothetical protein [Solirubrobacteraceae bacterium]